MNNKNRFVFKHFKQVLFYSLILFITSSCEDDPQVIGLNLIPDSDKVNVQYVDTFTIYAHTEVIDSQITSYQSIAPIGNLHDPIFGYTKASLLSEYYPIPPKDGFQGTNPVLDSIMLNLYPYSFNNFHGDSATIMRMKVYRYHAALPEDSSLYSNHFVSQSLLEKIGEVEYTPNQEVIKIFLSNDFGNELLTPPEATDIDLVLDSMEIFNGLYHNLYFETEEVSRKGSVSYFNVASYDDAFISLHYSYKEENEDTTGTLFYIMGNGSRPYKNVSIFEHDYSTASFDPNNVQDTVVYLQSLAGTKAVLQIPGLTNLFSSSTISVSSAKLLLPLEDFDKTKFIFPPSNTIGITAIDSDNSEYELVDNEFIGYSTNSYSGGSTVANNYIGGGFDESFSFYEMNITRHIESIFNKENENLGFNVFVAEGLLQYSTQSSNRVVLTNHLNSNPIKLQIVYTKLAN